MLQQPDSRYTVVPGIVHTDFYHQIHIVLNINTREEFMIPEGTPLQHMIPIRRNSHVQKIIWGNESMFRFVKDSGTSNFLVRTKDTSLFYRQKLREIDNEQGS